MRELPDNYLIQVMEDVIEDLHGHVHRVSNLAVDLGRGLGLGEDDLDRLALAGVLHDVGKIHMDPEILGKPGPLDPSEKDLMERHPELGFAMTRNRLDPKIAEAILYHHERFDGRGYPFGLTGNAIPILSRIVLVADAFDAMTSTRAYQPALPVGFAVNEIHKNAGTQFDPAVVEIFLELAAVDALPLELSA
ncbi:MAG TPA: HD domain-containing phosphohydrolase [Acidimicrobiia bacterium]|jgi:HD-GYP domain-containing protein (c-di-GMP phosphodiesterase class II)|nr:HD domain-containing phosphohydrolase [Acidimicrobiia bacterium]